MGAHVCQHREILQRIGDKWAIYVVGRLGDGPLRFSELMRGIDGITGRMLTVTLRSLERDGIITRTMHAEIPPRVDYELTSLGVSLLEPIGQLIAWTGEHAGEIASAQVSYDLGRDCPNDASDSPASQAAPRA